MVCWNSISPPDDCGFEEREGFPWRFRSPSSILFRASTSSSLVGSGRFRFPRLPGFEPIWRPWRPWRRFANAPNPGGRTDLRRRPAPMPASPGTSSRAPGLPRCDPPPARPAMRFPAHRADTSPQLPERQWRPIEPRHPGRGSTRGLSTLPARTRGGALPLGRFANGRFPRSVRPPLPTFSSRPRPRCRSFHSWTPRRSPTDDLPSPEMRRVSGRDRGRPRPGRKSGPVPPASPAPGSTKARRRRLRESNPRESNPAAPISRSGSGSYFWPFLSTLEPP